MKHFLFACEIRIGFLILATLFAAAVVPVGAKAQPTDRGRILVQSLPPLPDDIGVAGSLTGIDNDALIVAGGANFAAPDDPRLFELPKQYHDRAWVLPRPETDNGLWSWRTFPSFRLDQPVAYSSVVDTPYGVLCLGGENQEGPTDRTFYLRWDPATGQLSEDDLSVPDLPRPCTAGGAALVDGYIYVVAGQVLMPSGERSASRRIWRIALAEIEPGQTAEDARWEPIPGWPEATGHRKMFPLVTSQHDGFETRLYVMGGRRFPESSDRSDPGELIFSNQCWSFDPSAYQPDQYDAASDQYNGTRPWTRTADSPVPLTAGTAVPYGPAHIIVPAYATGDVLQQWLDSGLSMEEFDHPGFPRTVLAYHTVTDSWTSLGKLPAGQVTTPAVRWGDHIILVSGEIRPRVRTNRVWSFQILPSDSHFGWFNMSIVALYLFGMLGIGFWFSRKNKTTDDYFRGGKSIPWWVAGCSIFATMLSSITYMAIPAKAFAQDWVYAVGNLLILGVAPIAVYIALPFFRRIDATSAYEYLEKRFSRPIRLIGSGSFSLFHIFRMGVVLALAALALASVTPLDPAQCVLVMGVLSIIYCTLGGIEAVVWTDTIQTIILLGGALLCLAIAWSGSAEGSLNEATEAGKFHLVNLDFGSASFTTMALWVVILGGLGQNVASYTADQTVVQRYMTTPDRKRAARSIWLNGWMAIPAGLIFFGLGTALWMYYRSHPGQLDPTMASDRVLPLFISQQLPIGIAGLVVAGIFAAAQSTVSTSMNSGATTLVTDFLRPFRMCRSEKGFLWAARGMTLGMGTAGTLAGYLFIDPEIKSLFDQFIQILGMFLGVLAGLFALGVGTRRANAAGSLVGAIVAILLMISIVSAANQQVLLGIDFRSIYQVVGVNWYEVSGYLYAFVGITTCFLFGYLASLLFSTPRRQLVGLTLWDPPGDGEAKSGQGGA